MMNFYLMNLYIINDDDNDNNLFEEEVEFLNNIKQEED
jgi:hypothetical protein